MSALLFAEFKLLFPRIAAAESRVRVSFRVAQALTTKRDAQARVVLKQRTPTGAPGPTHDRELARLLEIEVELHRRRREHEADQAALATLRAELEGLIARHGR